MGTEITDAFANAWEDGPSSSPTQPYKASIRTAGRLIQAGIDNATTVALNAAIPPKQSVRVRATGNVVIASALENGDTLNGVTLATGDRVLLPLQSTASQNGVYVVVASGAASRSTDMDTSAEILGARVYVESGSVGAGETWACTNTSTITVGSTSITFVKALDNSALATKVTAVAGDLARPQEQAGPAEHTQIAEATATGKPVEFGGFEYNPSGALGTWGAEQAYLGRGAVINWTIDNLAVILSDETRVDGLTFVGSGDDTDTGNSAIRLPADKGGVTVDFNAFDMGKDAFQSINNANRYPSRVTGYFWNNTRSLYFGDRGEYTLIHDVAITATAVSPGVSTQIGIDMVGGNNPIVGAAITNMGTGLKVSYGNNDAHSVAVGVTSNHNDISFDFGAISTLSYVLTGSAGYAGKFKIGGRGYLITSSTFGSWGIEESSTALYSTFMGNSFRHMPDDATYVAAYGGYAPNTGGASCVFYGWNDYPQTVLGNDPWRQVTARSKRTVSGNVTVATGTPAKLDFDTSAVNALHANTSFSKHTLYDTTNDCWTMLSFASPFSTGNAVVDISVTLGKSGTFDDSAVDVYLSIQNNSGTEQERRYFTRSGNRDGGGGTNKRIFSFNGSVPKNYRMAVYVDNRSGGSIIAYADSQTEFPTVGEVRGW